jgi:hypothetical protein
MRKTAPYDTGKVKIGLAYQPPIKQDYSVHEERLQSALLDKGGPDDLADRWFMRCLYVIGLITLAIVIITA